MNSRAEQSREKKNWGEEAEVGRGAVAAAAAAAGVSGEGRGLVNAAFR